MVYGGLKKPMNHLLGTSIAADLNQGARYEVLSEAFGGYSELVTDSREIGLAMKRAIQSELSACLKIICDPRMESPRSSVLM